MPSFHLVADEIVAVANHRFRVQVWRSADSRPLVLLSQVQGHPPPDWVSSRLANLVLRSFLGYSLPLPIFFEVSRWNGQVRGVPSPLRDDRLPTATDPCSTPSTNRSTPR